MAEIIPVQLQHEMEVIVENVSLVLDEYSLACRKHPKFCDKITASSPLYWRRVEKEMKLRNSHPPFCADNILMEEIGEALNAFLSGDKQHAKQELAQCAAVILRMMAEMDK